MFLASSEFGLSFSIFDFALISSLVIWDQYCQVASQLARQPGVHLSIRRSSAITRFCRAARPVIITVLASPSSV